MRILAAALLLSVSAAAAHATEAKTGTNVVEFDVLAVAAPPMLPGVCAVSGITSKVWEGEAYRFGQPLLLSVPCATYGLLPAKAPSDGIVPVNVRSLQQSRHGIARLTDDGKLLWQDGGKNYGLWGQVAGYRVLDVRMLPAIRS